MIDTKTVLEVNVSELLKIVKVRLISTRIEMLNLLVIQPAAAVRNPSEFGAP